jgi:hypothetical protein
MGTRRPALRVLRRRLLASSSLGLAPTRPQSRQALYGLGWSRADAVSPRSRGARRPRVRSRVARRTRGAAPRARVHLAARRVRRGWKRQVTMPFSSPMLSMKRRDSAIGPRASSSRPGRPVRAPGFRARVPASTCHRSLPGRGYSACVSLGDRAITLTQREVAETHERGWEAVFAVSVEEHRELRVQPRGSRLVPVRHCAGEGEETVGVEIDVV